MSKEQKPGDTPEPEQGTVEDLHGFMRHLVRWHSFEVARVQHLLNVPDGTTFEIDGKELVLAGDALAGFKFGVEMALMRFAQLPFTAVPEEGPPTDLAGNPQH